jgi:AraC family transcriptional regulator, arabinose operon regulatory protein
VLAVFQIADDNGFGFRSPVVSEGVEKGSGFAGQQRVVLPQRVIEVALRQQPLLRGLLAAGAGYFPKAAGHLRRRPEGIDQAILIYCVKGRGWFELGGRAHRVNAGDLLVLPPEEPHAYGAEVSEPWTIHWIHAVGENVPVYLKELGASSASPIVWVGEELQLVLLFHEVLKSLEKGFTFEPLLQAAAALAHLMAVILPHRHQRRPETAEGFHKIGRCIEYMSEHLDQPLKVASLAALANLSPAHFAVVFKEQTGSSPRDYLHLLRMHRACLWLTRTRMALKEMADRLGYQDQFHFSRKFKAFAGLSPSEYRVAQRLRHP